MRNLISGLIAILLMASACQAEKGNFAYIEGRFHGDTKGIKINLSKVVNGKTLAVSNCTPGNEGRFGFTCPINESGIYVINVIKNGGIYSRDVGLNRFFLEKGTTIDLDLWGDKYELRETNNHKNEWLTELNTLMDTVFTYSHGQFFSFSTYEEFFPLLPEYVANNQQFQKRINTGDKDFDELLTLMAETDINSASLKFVQSMRKKHPKRGDYPDYYDVIREQKAPVSPRMFELPTGFDYILSYARFAVKELPEQPAWGRSVHKYIELTNNEVFKGHIALYFLKRKQAYNPQYLEFKEDMTPYLITDYLKDEARKHDLSIRQFAKGTKAFNFVGTDTEGKEHSLYDYKGSLIYVDVWATWCGPCTQEIPHLEKLEKKFHGKKVKFISYSLDKPRDLKKWQAYVNKHNMSGLQLVGDKGFGSDIAQDYAISSIPRFMLFDQDMKIISVNAPRPSSGKVIEDLINSHL